MSEELSVRLCCISMMACLLLPSSRSAKVTTSPGCRLVES